MSKQIIRCLDCEFCEGYRKLGNTRHEFFCKHLDQEYIHDYFEEHLNEIVKTCETRKNVPAGKVLTKPVSHV